MVDTPRLRLNLVLLLGGELIAKILGFCAFAWLGRCLGETVYGQLESAIAIVFVLALVQEAGLAPYGAREAARDPTRTPKLAARIGLARMVLAVIAYAIIFGLVTVFPRGESADRLVLLAGLILLPAPFILNWAFEARDRMAVVSGTSILRQAILATCVFIFVRDRADAWVLPLADAIGLAAAVTVQQFIRRREKNHYDFTDLVAGTRRECAAALPLAASTLAWAIRVFSPLIALYYVGTEGEAGRFAAGHRLIVSAHVFCWLYFVNLLPTLSRLVASGDEDGLARTLGSSIRLVAYTVFPICGLGLALGPRLLPAVFGPEFNNAGGPFGISVWMLAAAFISGHARYLLIASDHQKLEFRASLIGAIVTTGGLIFCHQSLTAEKAAVILVAGETTTMLVAGSLLGRSRAPLGLLFPTLRATIVFGLATSAARIVVEPVEAACVALGVSLLALRLIDANPATKGRADGS